MSDALTIVLDGRTVTLDELAKAVSAFAGLVTSLSAEVAAGAPIEWEVASLEAGSATATVRGRGRAEDVELVVRAYERVGNALERGSQEAMFSTRVQRNVQSLTALIGDRIEAIRFETDERVGVVRRGVALGLLAKTEAASADAYGAVEGTVETLSRRGGLRFTLFDSISDRGVSCYLSPGYESIMRDVWGKRAVVFGKVHRDPLTGRPIQVRGVTSIGPVAQGNVGDWRQARGAASLGKDFSAVEAIRALRDE